MTWANWWPTLFALAVLLCLALLAVFLALVTSAEAQRRAAELWTQRQAALRRLTHPLPESPYFLSFYCRRCGRRVYVASSDEGLPPVSQRLCRHCGSAPEKPHD